MSNEQKTQHYISIMQAYIAGEAIQVRDAGRGNSPWCVAGSPTWNFAEREYRIKPKSKPSVDWFALCKDIQFIARDGNGKIYGYGQRPMIRQQSLHWSASPGGTALHLDPIVASLTPGDCDWLNSLVERP